MDRWKNLRVGLLVTSCLLVLMLLGCLQKETVKVIHTRLTKHEQEVGNLLRVGTELGQKTPVYVKTDKGQRYFDLDVGAYVILHPDDAEALFKMLNEKEK